MPSLSRSLEQALHRAIRLASERHHEYATLEHLLLALVDDADAAQVMRACNVDLDALRTALTKYVDEDLATLTIEDGEDAKPTTGFQRVVQRAVLHVQNSGRDEVTGANVLVALFSERESHAVYFLQEQNMSRLDAVNYMSHGIAKRPGMSQAKPVRGSDEEEENSEKVVKQGTDALEAYRAVNVQGTEAMARQAAVSGVRRLIFLSSIRCAGPSKSTSHVASVRVFIKNY